MNLIAIHNITNRIFQIHYGLHWGFEGFIHKMMARFGLSSRELGHYTSDFTSQLSHGYVFYWYKYQDNLKPNHTEEKG